MREVIEDLKKPKAGIIPMAKIQDKAALYQDTTKLSSYSQGQSCDGDHFRALAELVQKVGIDRLQSLITPTVDDETVEEENEWNQNFDYVP
jgi:hypothetical protein